MKTTLVSLAAGALLIPLGVGEARADESTDIYSYAWNDSRMQTGIGVSGIIGGGVAGFTDQTMRDSLSTTVEGLWSARMTIGSHIPLGLDLAYVGTGAKINSLIGSTERTLVGTGFEAALRWNMLPHYKWNPYAFAGIGWQRYDITGSSFALSDTGLNTSDNLAVFPLGAGVAYRDPTGLVVDLHGTFRPVTGSDLVLDGVGSDSFAPLHTWEASAAVGYEF